MDHEAFAADGSCVDRSGPADPYRKPGSARLAGRKEKTAQLIGITRNAEEDGTVYRAFVVGIQPVSKK
jgi:hypothetical protein